MQLVRRLATHVQSLPLIERISPAYPRWQAEDLEGFRRAQDLARQGVREIASFLDLGWSESRAAALLNTYLEDHGVQQYFHKSFVWFGPRCHFEGVRSYRDYQASQRLLTENDTVILDVAPIYQGFSCDIGYSFIFGQHPDAERGLEFLRQIRERIPGEFQSAVSGSMIWKTIDSWIVEASFENIHKNYPFGVLGHRLYRGHQGGPQKDLLNFGWQSYWAFLSRGLLGQILDRHYEGQLDGLWAIEPHIGGNGWGLKFEEILIVEDGRARWLDPEGLIG